MTRQANRNEVINLIASTVLPLVYVMHLEHRRAKSAANATVPPALEQNLFAVLIKFTRHAGILGVQTHSTNQSANVGNEPG